MIAIMTVIVICMLRIRYIRRYLLWAFGILPVSLGVVICARTVEHDEVAFSDLSVAVPWRERLYSTISSSSDNIMPGL